MNYTLNKRCTAHVTLKRGRVKEYGSDRAIYLKDGQEFEIELFNPHTKSVLAKIFINGTLMSGGGLVLRPGQKIFLERYLDNDKKFKFGTYEVEDTQEVSEAIVNNGSVEVQFFYEYEPVQYYGSTVTISNPLVYNWPNNNYINCNSSGSTTLANYGASIPTSNFFCSTTNLNQSSLKLDMKVSNTKSVSFDAPDVQNFSNAVRSKSIETGRIEEGSKSNQKFTTVNDNFCSYSSETVSIKILPFSQKVTEVSEIRNYCPSCGTRMKKSSWKFCPSCGTNLEN